MNNAGVFFDPFSQNQNQPPELFSFRLLFVQELMKEQFNNLDVSNLDECPAEETFDETTESLSASLSPLQDVDPVVSRLTHVRPEQPGVAVQFGF